MFERSPLGLILILAGLGLLIAGALFSSGALSWLGRLPGDIRVERPNFRFYMPITSMVIVSVVLTLLLSIARRFW